MADNLPPLPPGFVLEGGGTNLPPLPPGFQIQQPEQPQIKAPIQQEGPPSQSRKGAILPISRDEQGNVSFDSDAGILGAAKRAFMLPGDVLAGEVDPTSEEGIGRAVEFAGVFGPTSPAAGSGRAIAEIAARQRTPGMETAAAAQRIGVDLPRAAASDTTAIQQFGKTLTSVPIGGTPLRKSSRVAIDQLGDAATRVQTELGSGSPAVAGGVAREGVSTYARSVLPGRVKDAYDAVDNLVTQNVTTPLSNTAKVATDIAASRQNASLGESGAVRVVREALNREGGLNYQGVKQLRTTVGELLDDPGLTASGVSQAELRRIYGALSDDLKTSVSRSGGESATKAFETANQLAARTSREREALQKILGRDISDESLFNRIQGMAGSTARADRVGLARVRNAVSDDTWNELASGVIARVGRDPDGNFSPDRFVTGWGKLSPDGKRALFGDKPELSSALDDIATVSRRFKQLNEYANPSGTGQTVLGGAFIPALYVAPTTTVAGVVGSRLFSSILAKPVSAKALAAYSKAYERSITTPSAKNTQALTNTSRALAALIANEAGDRGLAAQIFPQISGVRQMPADQRNEYQRGPEGQNRGVQQQPRMLLPNET